MKVRYRETGKTDHVELGDDGFLVAFGDPFLDASEDLEAYFIGPDTFKDWDLVEATPDVLYFRLLSTFLYAGYNRCRGFFTTRFFSGVRSCPPVCVSKRSKPAVCCPTSSSGTPLTVATGRYARPS
jgi:hypothetical protein